MSCLPQGNVPAGASGSMPAASPLWGGPGGLLGAGELGASTQSVSWAESCHSHTAEDSDPS